MSARIPDEDACHRARNLCVFERVQNGTPGMTHKECVLQRVSLDALNDVTVVLWMRQSIVECFLRLLRIVCTYDLGTQLPLLSYPIVLML